MLNLVFVFIKYMHIIKWNKDKRIRAFQNIKNNFFAETDIGCNSQKRSVYERRMEIYLFVMTETVLDQTNLCFLLGM